MTADCDDVVHLHLPYHPPFPWRHLLGFLAARAIPGVEHVSDDAYTRGVRSADTTGWFRVRHAPRDSAVVVETSAASAVAQVEAAARRIFDLDAQPDVIAATLSAEPRFAASLARVPGLRLPGTADPFEAVVRAIVGQQVSVAAACTIVGRLAHRFGDVVAGPHGLNRTMPSAASLAGADPGAAAGLGMPLSRATTLVRAARAVADGTVDLESPDVAGVHAALLAIPGIGPWTAEYVALRGLHWRDAFPAADLGVRKALGVRDATAEAEAWRPWRGYAVMHLWESLRAG